MQTFREPKRQRVTSRAEWFIYVLCGFSGWSLMATLLLLN